MQIYNHIRYGFWTWIKQSFLCFGLALILIVIMASFLSYMESFFWTSVQAQETATLAKPPKIKAGLFNTDDWVEVKVNYPYYIRTGDKQTLAEIKSNATTKIKYNKETKKYIVKTDTEKYTSDSYIKIVPKKANRIITITSYENRPSWDTSLNDNQFKGKLKIEYAPATDKTWVVNIIGLENYVKGIAEATNDNEPAYLKTLLTAARTYAYWHYMYPNKHADEPYLLDGTANDQVYKGWGFTKRAPNVKQAVIDTKGQIITYENEPIVAAYFSQSDGRTRDWSEVWGGDYDYMQSVDDPGCAGDTLTGHGVGMSAKGARYFASELDWGWKKILKYYYTGVSIEKIYE